MEQVVKLPKLIDCHVHFREPGLEHKATLASEAEAAKHGGIAVACEMPNTKPPTQSVDAFADKVRRAADVACDMRFFFGATADEHLAELRRLWTAPELADLKKRCSGLKLYLDNSTGDLKSDTAVVERAFELCAQVGIPLVVHCEHSATNDAAAEAIPYTDVASHSQRRPPKSEVASIKEAIGWATTYGTAFHVAHMSTRQSLEAVVEARKNGVAVTCEVCVHHLFLSTDDYAVLGAKGKVNPPLRGPDDRDALWEGVLNGSVNCFATDHAPHLLSEKNVTEGQPPSGLTGVEYVVPLLLTVINGKWPHPTAPAPAALGDAANRKLTVDRLVEMMHTNPKIIFKLQEVGDEPACVVDFSKTITIDEASCHSKCLWSPYHGWTVVAAPTFL